MNNEEGGLFQPPLVFVSLFPPFIFSVLGAGRLRGEYNGKVNNFMMRDDGFWAAAYLHPKASPQTPKAHRFARFTSVYLADTLYA